MPTITLKNIPDRLYEQLKVLAKIRHRSLNKEIISCLENSLKNSELHPEEIRMRAKIFRESLPAIITLEEIEDSLKTAT